jgi:glycosyltransferase involved in cell wall biosynthesis
VPTPNESSKPLPIMIKTWAGAQSHDYTYIRRSITSLLNSDLPAATRIVLIDDCSTDTRVLSLLEGWAADPRVELWRNPERMGPNRGQAYNFPRVVDRFPEADVFVMCDDDIIYHRDWLRRLLQIREEAQQAGLSGVFSAINLPNRPTYATAQLPTTKVLLKRRQFALNWMVPRSVYETVGPFVDRGVAFDTDYCDRLTDHNVPIICLEPSYIQNIGYYGAYQSGNEYVARDFVGGRDWWMRSRDVECAVRRFTSRAGGFLRRRLPFGRSSVLPT